MRPDKAGIVPYGRYDA